jgi:aspartate kinase
MFTALARNHVNIDCISTSEMKVSCVIAASDLDQGVRAVHAEFFGNVAAGRARKSTAAKKTAARKAAVTQTAGAGRRAAAKATRR